MNAPTPPVNTLENVWIRLMQDILTDCQAQHVEEDYRELRDRQVTFGFADIDSLRRFHEIDCHAKEMFKVFFTTEDNAFGHSYAAHIETPRPEIADPCRAIAAILKEKPTSRKAVMTFVPYRDLKTGRMNPPCISAITFLLRDNRLNVSYSARGQDIFVKFPVDAMCIAEFGRRIAKLLDVLPGVVTASIVSAHIYDRDIDQAKTAIRNAYDRCTILTGNVEKYRGYEDELRRNGIDLLITSEQIPEVQDDDVVEVVKAKARWAYERFGRPVFVDDMSLTVEAYPGFPGPNMKSIWRQLGCDGLSRLMQGKSKNGCIVCRLCAYDGSEYRLVEGSNAGYFDFSRPVENSRMPLNSVFVGEGLMVHRDRAIAKLIAWSHRHAA